MSRQIPQYNQSLFVAWCAKNKIAQTDAYNRYVSYVQPRLHGLVLSGALGISIETVLSKEAYFIFCTKHHDTLMILHIDSAGIDFTKCRLFNKKFKIMLQEQDYKPISISREQLKRLILDGSYDGPWESQYLAKKSLKWNHTKLRKTTSPKPPRSPVISIVLGDFFSRASFGFLGCSGSLGG